MEHCLCRGQILGLNKMERKKENALVVGKLP